MGTTSPPASFATLPSELLAEIIGLALPDNIPNVYVSNIKPRIRGDFSEACKSFIRGLLPGSRRRVHRYAVLYVSKQFHAEAIRILEGHHFSITLTERLLQNFWQHNMPVGLRSDLVGYRRAYFPGLDLRNIRGLSICIQPTSLTSFWPYINDQIFILCSKHLLPRGPLRSLTVEIEDMRESEVTAEVLTINRFRPSGITVRSEDYLALLEHLKQVIIEAGQCEIRLPYWMSRINAGGVLKLVSWKLLGAKVGFVPYRVGTSSTRNEADTRVTRGLVPLSDELTTNEHEIKRWSRVGYKLRLA